jgi:hypothetical protein
VDNLRSDISMHLFGEGEENHENHQSGCLVPRPRFEIRISLIENYGVIALIHIF